MDEIKDLNNRLDYMFLKAIITGLRDESITVADAKHFAESLLMREPFQSLEDAQTKVHAYVSEYPKFSMLKDFIDAYEREKHVDTKIAQMQTLIKNNNIEEALSVAKA